MKLTALIAAILIVAGCRPSLVHVDQLSVYPTVTSNTVKAIEMTQGARFGESDVQPFDFIIVKYRDVLADPKKAITEVARFIQADPKLIDYAVSSVDASKIRFKKEELSAGI